MFDLNTILYQVRQTGNYDISLPEYFNFGFDIIDSRAAERDKTAYIAVDRSGESIREYRYSDLSQASNRFANVLRDLDVAQGAFAVVILPRIPAWYEVIIGCIKARVVSMPGTNLLTAKDIEYRVNKSAASVVIVTPEHVDKIESIRANCPTLQHFIVVNADSELPGWTHYEQVCSQASDQLSQEQVGRSRSDEMMMAYFTSGTTSLPKMVPRNHDYSLAHLLTGVFWLDLKESDIHWTLSDTGWAKAAWGMLFPPWLCGATTVLYDGPGKFEAETHLKLIERLKVSTFCAPPTIYRIFAQMNLAAYDLSSIRHATGAGEPLNPEVIRIWQQATGTTVHDGYGQTETVCLVANVPGMEVRPGSMGKPIPGMDVQIVDDDGNICKDQEIGHIAIRETDISPPGLFDGYYEGPHSRNRDSFRNGFYYTGDTATRDSDGYIWFVGRADDIISSAGYRISPFEVESVLLEHDAVAESAVVAKPDDLRGHIVKAFIVLAEGFQASEQLKETLQEYVKTTTAPYKYPREIEFVENLPKTISGKIRRVELREQT